MTKKTLLPQIAIVGRTNVGKSTLFNRLSDEVKSIVLDYHGVTRDVVKNVVNWKGISFQLIDTGGIVVKTKDTITQRIKDIAYTAVQEANIVLFIVDGKVGATQEEMTIVQQLRKLEKKVLLVINKVDNNKALENAHEFDAFGYSESVSISAQHGKGIDELLDMLIEMINKYLPEYTHEAPESKFRVAVLGKPNVGKSSLINALLNKERFIVADQPGTTREAISETVRFFQEDIILTDTPGIRKKRAVQETLETLMVKSSFQAIEQANIIMLMIDACQGTIVDQELKLAFYIFEKGNKPLLVLFNKQDKMDDLLKEQFERSLEPYKHFTTKIPMLSISCKTGKNVGKVLFEVEKLHKRAMQELPSDQLTMLFKQALERKPLYKNQQLLQVKNARQIKKDPPTILLNVSQAHLFGDSQCAFFERLLRDKYDLVGVPIKFVIKNASR